MEDIYIGRGKGGLKCEPKESVVGKWPEQGLRKKKDKKNAGSS
jgi:hypothetical protein